ncbi:MAG: hypothetical protein ABI868_26420 [Acidobacteriota bacterium]
MKSSIPALLLVLLAGCVRHGAEQLLLEQFFNASRLRDRTALQKIATVILEPVEQGAVTAFTIDDVVDLEAPDGVVRSKQVRVSAALRLADGRAADKTLNLILQRGDSQAAAAWIVTGLVVQ